MITIEVVHIKKVGSRSNLILIDRTTPYGNRTRISEKIDRREALRRFELDVQDRPQLVEKLMHEVLRISEAGHLVVYLGCHCKPLPCHGDIWKKLLMERLA